MKTDIGRALEWAEKHFDEEWVPKVFPQWYGTSLWRWLTRPFRIRNKDYAKDYYRLGFVEGYQKREQDEKEPCRED